MLRSVHGDLAAFASRRHVLSPPVLHFTSFLFLAIQSVNHFAIYFFLLRNACEIRLSMTPVDDSPAARRDVTLLVCPDVSYALSRKFVQSLCFHDDVGLRRLYIFMSANEGLGKSVFFISLIHRRTGSRRR